MIGRRTGQVVLMLAGLIAWAVQFTIIYGTTATLCGREWADTRLLGTGSVQATILAATLTALIVTAFALITSLRDYRPLQEQATADRFMGQAGAMINGFSLLVILWHGIPAFILPACA